MPKYLFFDICVNLPFDCSFAIKTDEPTQVEVTLEHVTAHDLSYQVKHDHDFAVLEFPSVGVFQVSFAKRRVNIQAFTYDYNLIGIVFATSLMTIWMQNDALVLHGSLIEYNHQGILISGASGTGKSTLVAELMRRKLVNVLSDDIVRVTLESDKLIGHRSYPLLKLEPELAKGIQHIRPLYPVPLNPNKTAYLLESHQQKSCKIDHIVLLKTNSSLGFDTHSLNLYNWIKLLHISAYRYSFLSKKQREDYFSMSTQSFKSASLHILTKNHSQHSKDVVIDTFIQAMNKETQYEKSLGNASCKRSQY